jgi:hypothetical protein
MGFCRATCFLACIYLSASCAIVRAGEPSKPPAAVTREQLEKEFEKRMNGCVLAGSFTVTGKEDDRKLTEERYTISKCQKLTEDKWLFQARIQYGEHDVDLPLTLDVHWAGDTPVITLTDLSVPGLGTFTARVLVYRDRHVERRGPRRAPVWQGPAAGSVRVTASPANACGPRQRSSCPPRGTTAATGCRTHSGPSCPDTTRG